MTRLILRRLLALVPLCLVISFIAFGIGHLVPGDAAEAIGNIEAEPEQIEAIRERLGLNRSFIAQYVDWLGGLVRGDLGNSARTGEPITTALGNRWPTTVSVMAATMVVTALIGIPVGVLAGLRANGVLDRIVTFGTTLALAIPNFWLALMLVLTFSVQLGMLPAIGFVSPSESITGWLRCLILPALTLATSCVAEVARQTRAGVISVAHAEYVRTATAKGIGRRKVVWKHMMRNASMPLVTVLSLQIADLLAGSVIAETIFGMPGIGAYALSAVSTRDLPVLQAVILLAGVIIVLVNLLTDILYTVLDPRVRVS